MSKVSVIGSGQVGQVLADGFLKHGYDVMRDIAPGKPGRIDFRATIPGRFEAEL